MLKNLKKRLTKKLQRGGDVSQVLKDTLEPLRTEHESLEKKSKK